MNAEEFNKLLNGPLNHPLAHFRLTRLSLALFHVVNATGQFGEQALREHCAERQAKDEQALEED